jgi:mannobiose 2-epimerase
MTSTRRLFIQSAAALVAGFAGRPSPGAWPPRPSSPPEVPRAGDHIDAPWFRKALREASEATLEARVTPSGFLAGSGPPAGSPPDHGGGYWPTGLGPGTPTQQARNIVVLATGFDVTREPRFREEVARAADFLLAEFRDGEYGGLFACVDPEGKVLDDRKESYGTAHAILGLAHAARVCRQRAYADAALVIWSEMKEKLRDPHGLFRRETSRDFGVVGPGKNTQNPVMHLFEALLALHDSTRSEAVFQDARNLADTVFDQLYREPGYIPELYDRDWKPIPAGPAGQREPDGSPLDPYNAYAEAAQTGHVEIGHLIEWAYFLSRAVEKGFPDEYLSHGERLLGYAMKVGYDAETGGICGYSDYDGRPTAESSTRGWQMAELLKALMNWAVLRSREDLWPRFDRSLAAVRNSGSLPDGFHGCGMYAEGLRRAASQG